MFPLRDLPVQINRITCRGLELQLEAHPRIIWECKNPRVTLIYTSDSHGALYECKSGVYIDARASDVHSMQKENHATLREKRCGAWKWKPVNKYPQGAFLPVGFFERKKRKEGDDINAKGSELIIMFCFDSELMSLMLQRHSCNFGQPPKCSYRDYWEQQKLWPWWHIHICPPNTPPECFASREISS